MTDDALSPPLPPDSPQQACVRHGITMAELRRRVTAGAIKPEAEWSLRDHRFLRRPPPPKKVRRRHGVETGL